MFISMVYKCSAIEKSVTKYALVVKKILAKCEICPTNHS